MLDGITRASFQSIPVERCLPSSVAKAMEDKCEADRGRHPRGALVQTSGIAAKGHARIATRRVAGWAKKAQRLELRDLSLKIRHAVHNHSVPSGHVGFIPKG
jgi:hypothetical protein